ncbi:hypothetical protein C8Q73DRAFT_794978 [Cubamyces lactineus]|nr:hypothetical protein C8Q73DRAFT_794978 [Cubamyces lactineus]
MEEDGRARKRRRASSDPSCTSRLQPHHPTQPAPPVQPALPPIQFFTRDKEFWFEDGSIILIAFTIGFKVYRRLLMEHSPFFRDLFRIPQPPTMQQIDGCPFVRLTDRPEQVRHLLRVLFPTNGNLVFGKSHASVSMDAVAATVRLAHKYQMDQLLAQGLSILMEYYTDDFDAWIKSNRQVPMTATDLDAISAINIAHLTKTPSILPLAFLYASRAGSAVLRGCLRDNVLAERLTIEDTMRVLDGRIAYMEENSRALARIMSPQTSMSCTEGRRCLRFLAAKACELDEALQMTYASRKVLRWADEYAQTGSLSEARLCDKCREMVAEREMDELRELWDDLPKFFGLQVAEWGAEDPA